MRPRFFLAEAWRSIRANAAVSIAATVTVLIAVFVLGAFIPSFLYVQNSVDNQKNKIDVAVYISDGATPAQTKALKARIDGLKQSGMVSEATYVSKDDALREMRKRVDPALLAEMTTNVLPASYDLKLANPDNAAEVAKRLAGLRGLAKDVGDPGTPGISYGSETADKLLRAAKFIQWAGLALISILLIASILLIGNTIRLSIFARRREVEVMKLVGATNWFIRWPFVIEGIICGLAGAVASVALLYAVKVGVVDQWIGEAQTPLSEDNVQTVGFASLALILVGSGALVGALGSGLTLRRFLKV
ncbi:MAG TPA: permease-like cell division protein FtsX [Miltoncostaeaceae bacterium]|nr:permease-like cell division protein FtsX [Miltoncostaeaceae bacterium]